MLTVSDSEDFLFDALRNGADGYLLKDLRPDQLYDMLRAVMRDEIADLARRSPAVFSRSSAASAVRIPAAPSAAEGPALTRREIEILQLVADGLSQQGDRRPSSRSPRGLSRTTSTTPSRSSISRTGSRPRPTWSGRAWAPAELMTAVLPAASGPSVP